MLLPIYLPQDFHSSQNLSSSLNVNSSCVSAPRGLWQLRLLSSKLADWSPCASHRRPQLYQSQVNRGRCCTHRCPWLWLFIAQPAESSTGCERSLSLSLQAWMTLYTLGLEEVSFAEWAQSKNVEQMPPRTQQGLLHAASACTAGTPGIRHLSAGKQDRGKKAVFI